MSKTKTTRQKKETRCRILIYIKAWAPVLTLLLVILSMMIPSLRYTVAGTGTQEPISEMTLLSNTWTTARGALFGGGDWKETELGFAKACFLSVLISGILFLCSAGMSIWASVGATRHFLNPKREGKERAIYLTFFNRPLLFVYQLLALPLLAFPRMIIWFYEDMLFYPTILNLRFPEPLMIAAGLLLIQLLLTCLLKKWEKRLEMDPFADPRRDECIEEEIRETPQFATAAEQEAYEMSERERAEQLERIRKLLSHNDDNDDANDKGNT